MKKQIFILLLSALLFQCKDEIPVPQSFPIVTAAGATFDAEGGATFEGELVDNGGHEILSYGFVYDGYAKSSYVGPGKTYELGLDFGYIVYELGTPGNKTFALKGAPIGDVPAYQYRPFVTYRENSVKKTSYGNVRIVDTTVKSDQVGWHLIAADEPMKSNDKVVASAAYGSELFFIHGDGKVTKLNVDKFVFSEIHDFPLIANQAPLRLYAEIPFVLNSQNNNVYSLHANSWQIETQLPFDHGNLIAGNIFTTRYNTFVAVFGSFGTYFYDSYRKKWETRPTVPISVGQSIITGTKAQGVPYVLTSDGSIWRFDGESFSLLTTLPSNAGEPVVMFGAGPYLYVGLKGLSDQKLLRFNLGIRVWSEGPSFPETLNDPIFMGASFCTVANKNANGNYDFWIFF